MVNGDEWSVINLVTKNQLLCMNATNYYVNMIVYAELVVKDQ